MPNPKSFSSLPEGHLNSTVIPLTEGMKNGNASVYTFPFCVAGTVNSFSSECAAVSPGQLTTTLPAVR